ncbi:MAG: hypothetical protein H0T51_25420 [Pirellulales bacterium]|nr:hypothetical protein [Pirellulales bacterium]
MIAFAKDCAPGVSTLPLAEVKRHDVLLLPRELMAKLGPASLTFAAVRRLARRDGAMFARVSIVADVACRGHRSTESDLAKLVHHGWLKCKGRQNRRTQTYVVPEEFMNLDGERKFAMFPRWMAHYVDQWAPRAVFAVINSKDSLNHYLGDGEAGETYGRLQYPIVEIIKHTGLSRPAIVSGKAALLAKEIIKVDGGERNPEGRMTPDTIYLNGEFAVLKSLIRPSKNPADCQPPPSKNAAGAMEESCGREWQNPADSIEKSCGRSDLEFLSESLRGTPTVTAEPLCAASAAAAGPPAAWTEVEEELRLLGVSQNRKAVDEARKRDVPIEDARRWIAEFRRKPGAWTAGALHGRFTGDLGDWPPDSDRFARQLASDVALAEQEARRSENDGLLPAREAERAHNREREAAFGAELATLSDYELHALFSQAHGSDQAAAIEMRLVHKSGKINGPQRSDLLKALEARMAGVQSQ